MKVRLPRGRFLPGYIFWVTVFCQRLVHVEGIRLEEADGLDIEISAEDNCRSGCKTFPAHCKQYPISCSGCPQCQADAEAPTAVRKLSQRHRSEGIRLETDGIGKETVAELCHRAIVSQTCLALDRDNSRGNRLTIYEVSVALSATRSSTIEFLNWIGLDVGRISRARVPPGAGGEEITCTQLCEASIGKVDSAALPSEPDVGCRVDLNSPGNRSCDIDLSPAALAAIRFPDHAGQRTRTHKRNTTRTVVHHNSKYVDMSVVGRAVRSESRNVDIGMYEALRKTCNFFRIYPMIRNSSDLSGSSYLEIGAGSNVSNAQERVKASSFDLLPEVEATNVVAQAYVAHAIQKALLDQKYTRQWFGSKAEGGREEIIRMLNAIESVLANVAFIRGGEYCDDDTFGYVDPDEESTARNSNGQYVMYLCDKYFSKESTHNDRIETLAHEGSHHLPANTDDQCAMPSISDSTQCDWEAYGREACRHLAVKFPDDAIANADSYCFYINDLNEII